MGKSTDNRNEQDPSGDVVRSSSRLSRSEHFDRARRIVESWPQWKRDVLCPSDPCHNDSKPAHSNET